MFDETLTENESEASDITVIEERMRALPLRDSYNESDSSDHDDYDDVESYVSSLATTSSGKTTKQFLPSCK